MKKTAMLLMGLASAMPLFAAEPASAPPIPDQTITVTAQTFAGLPRVKAEAKEHENPAATYEGVTLGAILEHAGVPRGEKLRGPGLRAIVIITATDGYEVVFTVARNRSRLQRPAHHPRRQEGRQTAARKGRSVPNCRSRRKAARAMDQEREDDRG
jgi:hypothetical protein